MEIRLWRHVYSQSVALFFALCLFLDGSTCSTLSFSLPLPFNIAALVLSEQPVHDGQTLLRLPKKLSSKKTVRKRQGEREREYCRVYFDHPSAAASSTVTAATTTKLLFLSFSLFPSHSLSLPPFSFSLA